MATRRKIYFKQTADGAAGTGEVTRISLDEDRPGIGHVDIRMGPKPPKRKDDEPYVEGPPSVCLDLPAKMTKNLKLGQKVRVSVNPI